jgi:hypothetical protein
MESAAVWNWKSERWGSAMVQEEKCRGRKGCDRRHIIIIIIIIIICAIYQRTKQLSLHAAICYFCTRSDVASRCQIPEWRSPKDFRHKTDTRECCESLHVLLNTCNTFPPCPNENVTSDHI